MVEHHENAKNEQKCGVQNQYDSYTLGLDFMTYSTCFRYFSQVRTWLQITKNVKIRFKLLVHRSV